MTNDPPILRNSALSAPLVVVGVALALGPWQAVGTAVGSAVVLANLWLLSVLAPRLVRSLAREELASRDNQESSGSPPVFWAVALLSKFVVLIVVFIGLLRVFPGLGLMLGFAPLMVGTLATGILFAVRESAEATAEESEVR